MKSPTLKMLETSWSIAALSCAKYLHEKILLAILFLLTIQHLSLAQNTTYPNFNLQTIYNHPLDFVSLQMADEFVANGLVVTTSGAPLSDVNINTSEGTPTDQLTGVDGSYSIINIDSLAGLTITPSYDTFALDCINVLDVFLIQAHAVGFSFFPTNHQKIAADVNGDFAVTTFDATILNSAILSGSPVGFADTWRFTPTSWDVPVTLDADVPDYPNTFSTDPILQDTSVDFVAMQVGDVDFCGTTTEAPFMTISTENLSVPCLSDFTTSITVSSFVDIAGLQFSINWDPAVMNFSGIVTNTIGTAIIDEDQVGSGILKYVWNAPPGTSTVSLADNASLLEIEFSSNGFGSTVLEISDNPVPSFLFQSNFDTSTPIVSNGIIDIADFIPPSPDCDNATVFLDGNGQVFVDPISLDAGSFEDCSDIIFSLDQSVFDCNDAIGPPITVTLTLEDQSGNTSTCFPIITVVDNLVPVALCQDIIAPLDINGQFFLSPFDIDAGSSDNCNLNYFLSATDFDCADIGVTNIVTLNVTDDSGNQSDCIATVTVVDDMAPSVICQTINVALDINGEATITPSDVDGGSFDNCTAVSLSLDVTDFNCNSLGANAVILTATDAFLNSTFCVATVNVLDVIAPTWVTASLPLDATFDCLNQLPAPNDPLATDECGGISISFTQTPTTPDHCNGDIITRTWTASDPSGNFITHSQTITLLADTEFPEVLLPLPVSEIADCATADYNTWLSDQMATFTAIDNCGSGIITYSNNAPASHPGCGASVGVVFSATDDCNSVATFEVSYTIVDNTGPAFTGLPTDVTVECDAIPPIPVSGIDFTTSDDCDADPAVTFTETNTQTGDMALAGFYNYTITRSWTATDDCGNATTATQLITVQDITSPNSALINGAAINSLTVSADPGGCFAFVTLKLNGFSDNCADFANLTLSNDAPFGNGMEDASGAYPVGSYTILFTAEDPSGNVGVHEFNLSVIDQESPVISSCPSPITVEVPFGQTDSVITWTEPTASDNCPGPVTITSDFPSGTAFPVGLTVVTYTATDNSGNTSTCNFTIQVIEQTCTIVCPADITLSTDVGVCTGTVGSTSLDPFNFNSNCDGFIIEYTLSGATTGAGSETDVANLPTVYNLGVTSVGYVIKDGITTVGTCSFTIIIEDTEIPFFIDCVVDISVEIPVGQADTIISWVDPISSDNCPPLLSLNSDIPSGTAFIPGVSTVTYTATDGSGNTNTCTFTVTVTEQTCTIICPSDITTSTDFGICQATISSTLLDPFNSNPNCNGFIIEYTLSGATTGTGSETDVTNLPTIYNQGTTIVEYVIKDGITIIGNCTFPINVNDNENPTLICPLDIITTVSTGQSGTIITWPPITAFDNCGDANITSTAISGDFFPIGVTTVIYAATDDSGNTSTCSFDVNISQISVCTLNAADTTICPNSDHIITIGGGYTDYLWDTGFNEDDLFVPGQASGTQTFSVTVTCSPGITATDEISITWADVENPIVICEDITIELDVDCEANFLIDDIVTSSSDNCTGSPTIEIMPEGPFTEPGINIITVTVTDESGNTASCDATVTVENNATFFGQCYPNLTYELDASGMASLEAVDLLQTISSICPPVLTTDITDFTCLDVGDQIVTLTVTANSGEFFTCQTTVTIEDNIPPIITYCPPDTTIVVLPTEIPYSVDAGLVPTFTDNCGNVALSGSGAGITEFSQGTNSLTVTGTDDSGNAVSCNYAVTILPSEIDNDVIGGSTPVDPNEMCLSIDGDLFKGTPSFPQPPPCSQGLNSKKDFWYTFTAPLEPVTIKVAGSPQFQAGMDVYTDNQTFVACKAADSPGTPDSLVLTLDEGETYFVRVYDVFGNPETTYFTMYIYTHYCPIPIKIPDAGDHIAETEFTDDTGWTHYIKQDSFLLFSINRSGRNIGNVNDGTFEVFIHRDSIVYDVYDVSQAPYALATNSDYLATGYYWNVTPNYAPGIDLSTEFTIRSYYTVKEFDSMRDTCPDLPAGDAGHEMFIHYKIDGPIDPNPAPPASHLSVEPEDIHLFTSGPGPVGEVYEFGPLAGSATDFIGEMCVILFSGGGFFVQKNMVDVEKPRSEWSNVRLLPVPAFDNINLVFKSRHNGRGQLLMYDVLGRIYGENSIDYFEGENIVEIDLNHLAEGVYFVQLKDERGGVRTMRFVKTDEK